MNVRTLVLNHSMYLLNSACIFFRTEGNNGTSDVQRAPQTTREGTESERFLWRRLYLIVKCKLIYCT
jgi:hypothetical protein